MYSKFQLCFGAIQLDMLEADAEEEEEIVVQADASE